MRTAGSTTKLSDRRATGESDAQNIVGAASRIDVKQLITAFDVRQHAELANEYFKDFDLNSAALRKPFAGFDTIELLPKLSVVLNNIGFFPGIRVLDFGGGTGWLALSLAMMGCDVICTDVSKAALKLGEQFTQAKYPELLDRLTYKPFDGHTVDLSDGSVDCIICFDSFHHVPNQEQILREFSRVLVECGRAVFSEPGPHHSETPQSQMEMAKYRVIENDIVIEDVWTLAKAAGFRDMQIAAFSLFPVMCSIQEFEALHSLETAEPIIRKIYEGSLCEIHKNVRNFVLYKDARTPDSRQPEGLNAELNATIIKIGSVYRIDGWAKNTGSTTWRPSGSAVGSVNLGISIMKPDRTWVQDFARVSFLDAAAAPGSVSEFSTEIEESLIGQSEVYLDLVAEQVSWFGVRSQSSIKIK